MKLACDVNGSTKMIGILEKIKELSNKLQMNVKDTIKKSLDLEVTEVNIRIKNIATRKENNIKE